MVTSAWPYSRLGAEQHHAAQVVNDEMQSIADAEYGHAERKNFGSAAGASAS